MDKSTAFSLVDRELIHAKSNFEHFRSPHEGYAIILEEVNELWKEIKDDLGYHHNDRMKDEAVQVAAMALRFLIDLC